MTAEEKAARDRELARIAANYKKLFESDAGRVVMADLERHFKPTRARFDFSTGFEPIKAAKIDGQADVMNHISERIKQAESKPETE